MSHTAISVNTAHYVTSHGKAPRGYGVWGFEILNETYFYTGAYGQAVSRAKKEACIQFTKISTSGQIYVLP